MSVLNSHHATTMAAQTGYAQSAQPGGQARRTRRVNKAVEDSGLRTTDRSSDSTEQGSKTDSVKHEVRRRERRFKPGRRGLAETASRSGGQSFETATPGRRLTPQEARQARASRFHRSRGERLTTLDRAFRDNSREIQARFFSQTAADGEAGPEGMSPKGRMRQIVGSLVRLCQDQLKQHTGDEPYMKADYRMFLATFQKIQNRGQADGDRNPWEGAPSTGGYLFTKLFDRIAAALKVLEPGMMPGAELELVA